MPAPTGQVIPIGLRASRFLRAAVSTFMVIDDPGALRPGDLLHIDELHEREPRFTGSMIACRVIDVAPPDAPMFERRQPAGTVGVTYAIVGKVHGRGGSLFTAKFEREAQRL